MDKLYCENYFCIYWEENHCILDKISLDVLGNCQDCIYVDIDESTLQKARQQALERFEKLYATWENQR